jgi:hypothetical protein
VSPQPKIQRIKVTGSCRPADWASIFYPLFIENLVQVMSDNAENMRWCPIMHEPCVVVVEEAHVPTVLVNHSPKTKVQCTC